jgi:hypothetical protein
VFMRVQARVRNREFTTSSHSVIEGVLSMTCEECFCDEKIYVEYLESEIVIVVRRDPLLGND